MNKTLLSKEKLESLYSEGKSMIDIAELSYCSVHKVAYWMEKYGIKRRSINDAIYLKLNPNGDPFKIKKVLSRSDFFLYGLGLGIYWGEGDKSPKQSVRVANTDPGLLIMFKKFLINICGVSENKILYSIICFNDSDPKQCARFWKEKLELLEEKFGKIVQIPPQGKGIYKNKSQFGVCTLSVHNIKFKYWIMQELANIERPG